MENTKHKLYKLAEEAISKAKKEKSPVVIRSGMTPSGTKHLGNLNDNLRGYFIYKIISEEKGYPAFHIQTEDDMEVLRKVPDRIMDLNGKWHVLDKKAYEYLYNYVGIPLAFVPDPFQCCKSWAAHFEKIWEAECKKIGLKDTKYFKTSELYAEGKFDQYIQKIFENIKTARRIILRTEKNKPRNYFPLQALCERCHKWTGKIIKFDVKSKKVAYVCSDRYLTSKYLAKGCGFKGETEWRKGKVKLNWEFEWPAEMLIFRTTLEPFGKDHASSAWGLASEVIKKIYEGKLPIPLPYEFFLVNGRKMATRHGNVYSVSDMLNFLEPEVLRFFYTKNPRKQRNINLARIYEWADEFDRAERVYFGLEKIHNKKEETKLKNSYKLAMLGNLPSRFPGRIRFLKLARIFKHDNDKYKKALKGMNSQNKRRLNLVRNWVNYLKRHEEKI